MGSDAHSTSAHEIELKPEQLMQPIQPIAVAAGSRYNSGQNTRLTETPNQWHVPATSQGNIPTGREISLKSMKLAEEKSQEGKAPLTGEASQKAIITLTKNPPSELAVGVPSMSSQ